MASIVKMEGGNSSYNLSLSWPESVKSKENKFQRIKCMSCKELCYIIVNVYMSYHNVVLYRS